MPIKPLYCEHHDGSGANLSRKHSIGHVRRRKRAQPTKRVELNKAQLDVWQHKPENKTLLVLNCHEAWVHQLGVLGYALDIVAGLRGHYHHGWDERMRPLPANARLIPLTEALKWPGRYYCIITHNTTDLLDVRTQTEPPLLVLHHTL